MMRLARDFRLIPVVLLATIALFALKISGLVFDGGYTLAERMENNRKPRLKIVAPESVPNNPRIVVADGATLPGAKKPPNSWAQDMFNFNKSGDRDVTGSVGHGGGEKKKSEKSEKSDKPGGDQLKVSSEPPGPAKLKADGDSYKLEPGHIRSPGERAVLESLQKRRAELDARSRQLDMRESLLKAAEKRVEAKVAELKGVESRVKTEMGNRTAAEQERLKSIITMYETMKPKDAARIFDRLDMAILIDVATHMKPRAMSAILAQMTPETAERLTVELANRDGAQPKMQSPHELPKIEGKTAPQ
jgi:flagellar motility protein MotE (MotC chaperone)